MGVREASRLPTAEQGVRGKLTCKERRRNAAFGVRGRPDEAPARANAQPILQ